MKLGYYFHISDEYTLKHIKVYDFGFCTGKEEFEDMAKNSFNPSSTLKPSRLDDINLDLSEKIGEVSSGFLLSDNSILIYSEKIINGGDFNGQQ